MYQSHFCLNDRPFAAAPNPEHYFPAASIERARESLMMSIERAAGMAVVIGAVGTGKTLLSQLVANQFSRELPVCMLSSARLCTRRTLLQAILSRLGLPIRHQDEGELRLTLSDHIAGPACPRGILLIVDEADRLGLEMLEELRVITNLVQNGEPRVRLVLTGGIRLEERMSHPKMESLNQRVVARLYLENFTADETADYMRARITACGGITEALFTNGALRAVYQATSGVPRLVNQVCDHALILAAVGAHDRLDADGIEEAWSDLQQLPLPTRARTTTTQAEETTNDVVEFGPLDDETNEHHVFSGQSRFDPSGRLEDIERQVASIGEEASSERSPKFGPRRERVDDARATIAMRPRILAETAASQEPFDDVDDHGDGQAAEPDEEGRATNDSIFPEIDLTIDQATNPFDEEFGEEEIVIRQFAMPSEIARRSDFQVVSNHSRELAGKLTAAHPGLRMHPHQDIDDLEDSDSNESEGFQPLTAYIRGPDDPPAFEDEHDESAGPIVDPDVYIGRHSEPATDASSVGGPEVVIQFDHNPIVWGNNPVVPKSDIVALGPAPTYRSDEYGSDEQRQPDGNSRVEQQVPQPEVVSMDPAVSRDTVASAGFNTAIYQESGSDSASPLQSFGPSTAPVTQDVATCNLSWRARQEPAVRPKLFRQLFSSLRRAIRDDD